MREFINPKEAALRPQPHEDYGRLSIDLSTARDNEEINIQGNYIAKIKYDGTTAGCYFKIDHRHAAKIYAKEFKILRRRYARLFLTNTAQAGKVFVIQINETAVSEITPELDTGKLSEIEVAAKAIQAIQAIDGGGDLQKVKEELEKIVNAIQVEDSAHTSTQKGVMPLAVRKNVASFLAEDGDYHPLEVSSTGELWVNDTDGNVLLGTIDSDTDAIKTAVEVMDDWDDDNYCRVVAPIMSVDTLSALADAATDTIAAPGAGYAIEVLGYQIVEYCQANATINTPSYLAFMTSSQQLWSGVLNASTVVNLGESNITNIRVRGNANEALQLGAMDVNAAAGKVVATIFYRLVDV